MDEKYIEDLYNSFGGANRFGAYADFKDLISTDATYRQGVFQQLGEGVLGAYADFEDLVKKKAGGSEPAGAGDSLSRSQKGAAGLLDLAPSVPGMVESGWLSPAYMMNRRQLADFARQGGLVAAPERSRQLADEILQKPVTRAEQERDRLIDAVDQSFSEMRTAEARNLQAQIAGRASQGEDVAQLQAELPAEVDKILQARGYTNAISFVDQALANGNYKALRDVINNAYGSQVTRLEETQAPAIAGKQIAQTRQEQQRLNVLVDKVGAQSFALTNPQIIEDYQYDLVGSKEVSKELTPNQYTGLKYLQSNYPEMYEQYSLELAKAADPKLFGRDSYDKTNRDYQYMLYTLDKRGTEINSMAIAERMTDLAPDKAVIDQEYQGRLSGLTSQMMAARDYETRTQLQQQINQVRAEYDTNPTVIQYGALTELARQNAVDFKEKYPDQASRARENQIRDILQDDGTGVVGAVGRRLKWLFLNTVTGVSNLVGGNEFEFGQSRNYIRNLRRAEEEAAELYQPTYNAAVQPLYKLNFSTADYEYIKHIRNSDMDSDEQAKLIGDYLEANADRIRYEENPEAGKRNWTWGAIGNQMADVGTQVLYQGALSMLLSPLGRTAVSTTAATRSAAAAAAVEGAGVAAAAAPFEAAAATIGDAAVRGALSGGIKTRLAQLGSVMGASYVTAYQPAYAEALAQGKSVEEAEAYANEIAIVNGLSEAISPDALVLRNAVKGVKGLDGLVTPSAISAAERLRTSAGYFMKGYAKNVGMETLEEITAAFGEYGVDQLHNMNQDEFNELGERLKNAAITTAIGMTPFGVMAGGSSVRASSRMQKEMFYQAGLYPEIIKAEINSLRGAEGISQAEANKRIQMVNTMSRIVQQLPPMDNGRPMPDRAKQDYAFNRLQQAVLENELQQVEDPNSRDFLKVQIAEYMDKNRRILRGLDLATGPAEQPVDITTEAQEGQAAAAVPAEAAAVLAPPPVPEAPAPGGYQVGQRLDSADLGIVDIIDRAGDVFTLRMPDGTTDQFTGTEIDELVQPRAVEQLRQTPPPAAPVPADVEPGRSPSIFVQAPGARPAAPEPVTIGADISGISSPSNTIQDATDQILQQEGPAGQYPQGDQGGQAAETGGSDRLFQPATDAGQGQVVESGVSAQAPIGVEGAPAAEATAQLGPAITIEQPGGQLAEVAFEEAPVGELPGLTRTQRANVSQMSAQRLYDNIVALDPEHPVAGRQQEYNRQELQSIYAGMLAAERRRPSRRPAPAAAPVPRVTPVQQASRGYTAARQAYDRARQVMQASEDPAGVGYAGSRESFRQAQQQLRSAEAAYLQALKQDNRELKQRRRSTLGAAAGRTDAQIITNYLEMAKVYTRQGVRSLQELADKLGEKVNPYMQRAWDIVHAPEAPRRLQGEGTRDYLRRLRSWEKEQVAAPADRAQRRAAAAERRSEVRSLEQGIQLLRKDINMPLAEFNQQLGLPAGDYATYVAALKWNQENNPIKKRSASAIMRQIRGANPRTVIATEMDLLQLRMREQERGATAGSQQGRRQGAAEERERLDQIRNQITDLVEDLVKTGILKEADFSDRDLAAVLRRANRVSTPQGLRAFSKYLDRVVSGALEAQTIEWIDQLQGELGKILRRKDVITSDRLQKRPVIGNRNMLAALRDVNPLTTANPEEFRAMLSNIVGSLQGKELLDPRFSNQAILDFLDQHAVQDLADRAADVKERYQAALDYYVSQFGPVVLESTMDIGALSSLVDAIVNDPARSIEQKFKELAQVRNAIVAQEAAVEDGGELQDLAVVYEQVRNAEASVAGGSETLQQKLIPVVEALQEVLGAEVDAGAIQATEQQAAWVQSMISLNPETMSAKQLLLLKNVIDNILVNQNFAGSQAFHVYAQAQQRVGNFVDWAQKQGVELRRDLYGGALGKAFKSLSSTDQVIRAIADNNYDMAVKLMDVSGLGDIKAGHAKAKQVVEKELTRPLKALYKQYPGLNDPASIVKRGMYAYLNQDNFGAQLDQDLEFMRRKGIVEQDIARKSTSDDPQVQKEVELLKTVYNENFAAIQNHDQLRSAGILNEGEQKVYNLFRDFYDRHKPDFRGVVENLLNLPFNEVNNYVKDAYKLLEGATVDADFSGLAGSAFLNPKNPTAPSTATMQRHAFSQLDNIAVTGEEGQVVNYRVINYAFDSNQLQNASAMMEDIYTLEPRMEAQAALSSKSMKDYMGGTNLKTLRDNVEHQVRAQQRLLQREQGSWAGDALEKLGNVINRVGVRQVLYSFRQFVQQPADIVVNTVANMGADFPMFFQAMGDYIKSADKAYMQDLLSQSEIALRGKTFGGTNWLSQQALDEIKQTVKNIDKSAELKDEDFAAFTISWPDRYFANVAWLAYYAQSLKRQGLVSEYSQIDWQAEAANLNREARDYAQLMTSTRLNVNSPESQSEFYAKTAGLGRLFQITFLPLSSFNMNNYSLMYGDVRTLMGDGSRAQKVAAGRSLMSRMLAELAYQTIRAYMALGIKAGVAGVLTLAGVEPPEKKDDDEFWWRVSSEAIKNMFFGLLGNVSAEAAAEFINYLGKETMDTNLLKTYAENPNLPNNNFGMFSIFANSIEGMSTYAEDIVGPTDKDGNPVEISNSQRAILAASILSNLASSLGYMEGDAKRIIDRAAAEISKEISKKQKDPYWILMNNPDAKPQIKIGGKQVDWTDEQLEYYNAQRQYHLEQNQERTGWTDEHKKRDATERAKTDLQKKFKLKFKKEKNDE